MRIIKNKPLDERCDLFVAPTNQQEAYDKWQHAIRVIKLLMVAELVSEVKVEQAIEIVRDLN